MPEETLEEALRRIGRLESALAVQEGRLAALESARAAAAVAEAAPRPFVVRVTPLAAPAGPAPGAEGSLPIGAPVAPLAAPVAAAAVAPGTATAAPPPSAPAAPAQPFDLEGLLGGAWLNRIGIAALVIGVAFFLQYAFANDWIGPLGRVAIGILIGVGFIAGGEVAIARKLRFYGQGLVGGGLAILYLSLFAGYQLYHLIPQGAAFGGMVVVTAGAVVLALREDAQGLAIMGLLGGFMTPLLLSSGHDNQIGLMSYMLVLDLGLIGVALRREWNALNTLSFFFTQAISAGWAAKYVSDEKIPLAWGFQAAFFVIFAAAPFVSALRLHRPVGILAALLALANAGAFFGWGLGFLEELDLRALQGPYTVALAAAYVGQGYLARGLLGRDRRLLYVVMGAAITLLSIAIPIQLRGPWISIAWGVEATVLLLAGARADSGRLRLAAFLLYGVALLRLLGADATARIDLDAAAFLNLRALPYAVIGGLLLLAGRITPATKEGDPSAESLARPIYGFLGNVVLLTMLVSETHIAYERRIERLEWPKEYAYGATETQQETEAREAAFALVQEQRTGLENTQGLMTSVALGAYGAGLVLYGFACKRKGARWMGLAILTLTVGKVFLVDLSRLDTIYRILSTLGLAGALLGTSLLYQRKRGAGAGPAGGGGGAAPEGGGGAGGAASSGGGGAAAGGGATPAAPAVPAGGGAPVAAGALVLALCLGGGGGEALAQGGGAAASPSKDDPAATLRYERPIAGPLTPGLARIELDATLLGHTRHDQGDVRVYALPSGAEVPSARLVSRTRDDARAVEARLRNLVTVPGDRTTFELTLSPAPGDEEVDEVEIETSARDFRRRVTIEGAHEGGPWGVVRDDAELFGFAGDITARWTRIHLPEITFRRLRVTVHDGGAAPLPGLSALVRRRARLEAKLEARIPVSATRLEDSSMRRTHFDLDLGADGLPVTRIVLESSQAAFARPVEVRSVTTESFTRESIPGLPRDGGAAVTTHRLEQVLGTGLVYRYERGGKRLEGLSFDLPQESTARHLRVSIANGDDPPLPGEVRLLGPRRTLVVEVPAGAEGLLLRYGDPGRSPPVYDLARRAGIDHAFDPAKLPPPLALGAERQSPSWSPHKAPRRPWTEEHPEILWAAMGGAIVVLSLLVWRGLKAPPAEG